MTTRFPNQHLTAVTRAPRAILLLLIAVLFTYAVPQTAFAETVHEKRIKQATSLIQKMTQQDDKSSLADVVASGKAVAIFPSVFKAGFILGGQGGEGLILVRKGKNQWTGPSFVSISGASAGLQIGAQSIGLVLVITNQDGLQAFTGGNSFTLGADASIAAGPVGRRGEAATDSRADASIYSYSMTKGLFAGISLEGAVVNQNRDANKAYWGKAVEPVWALKQPAKSAKINPLVAELNKLVKKAPK